MAEYDIAVIGGDKRTAYMIPFFMERGYRVIGYKVCHTKEEIQPDGNADTLRQALESAGTIVGGIPIEKKGVLNLRELSRHLRRCHTVFGGVIPEAFRQECGERGIPCHDFMKDEGLAIFNAIATAEGAILEALQHKETNIHQSKSLVLGYGRCGKVLSDKLKALCAEVTVCTANQTELALAESLGMKVFPVSQLTEKLSSFEYIYNTVPAVLLTKERLKRVRTDALVIDIASGRGGLDYDQAKQQQLKAFHCLGLPGKYAARVSAGRLADYVIEKLM